MKNAPGNRWSLVDRIVIVWLAWSFAGLVWTPYDPQAQSFYESIRAGPSLAHWFGVDSLGRDLFSRLWLGSGHTVLLGGAAALGTFVFAILLLVAERNGPAWAKSLIRSLVSAGLAMPVMFVGLILLVFLDRSTWTLVLACALGGVPFGFRQLRIAWIEQAGALHVLASRALGAGRWHVGCFSIWPNVRRDVAALAKLLFAAGVLELSGLTFLGLTGDPDYPELGTILRQNQPDLFRQPLLVLWPGLFLAGLLLVVHLSNIRSRSSGSRGPD